MPKKPEIAEALVRHAEVKVGSNRSFGIVFTIFFAVIALWPLLNNNEIRIWATITSCVFLVVSLFIPVILTPLNKIWFKFSLLLHHIVNPIIMAVMFFLIFTPVALTLRLLRKDLLRLRFDKKANTYWIDRDPPGPDPQSMRNQF